MTATTFGRYIISRHLGAGGMADVYLAHDPALDRDVALKVPRLDSRNPDVLARFMIEAKAVAQLEGPAIVPLYEYGKQDGQPFLIMRYLRGGSLADRIGRSAWPLPAAVAVIDRIAAALDYAHVHGVIHRDVKPSNILFDDDGAAYLSDFGIARMVAGDGRPAQRLTATGLVHGSVDYMSPEQALGRAEIDGRSDIYSLGVVLFEMLAGDIPYQADSQLQQAMQHVNAPIPSLRERRPDLPPAIQSVIERALAKDPAGRYPTAAALAADLRRVAAGQRPFAPVMTGQNKKGWPIWVTFLAIAGFLLLAGFAVAGRDRGSGSMETNQLTRQTTSSPAAGETFAEVAPIPPTAPAIEIAPSVDPTSTVALSTTNAPLTPSPTPSLSPSPTSFACPGAFPTRVTAGGRARVINYQLNVRAGPGTDFAVVRRLDVGRTMDILDGPVCDDGQLWYFILSEEIVPRDGSGPYRAEGWLIEESDDEYYLEPIP